MSIHFCNRIARILSNPRGLPASRRSLKAASRSDCAPGQQHQQFRALGLGQRPYPEPPTSFTNHLRQLESYRRNKHHHHHHHHQQQQQGVATTAAGQLQQSPSNGAGGGCANSSATSPSSGSHLAAEPGGHQDCYKHSPQHGGEFAHLMLCRK